LAIALGQDLRWHPHPMRRLAAVPNGGMVGRFQFQAEVGEPAEQQIPC